ncbi:methyl-accepting chemotaxis protein [Vibrio sp. SCSIO 43137]|uniref:methyl-accepting chemotaxis protein n=1 Tax=Vibrio sp. SCSIO 43137 TaxID=3021011 RepID=UPI00230795D0|nr:methyl-accepting chemotaxis protein [Vibrio sp. SCSIO 43137]WCE31129.1 methyl-accepting chemotaxis protein [Vibrio sp. SCSIO 43137]
MDWLGNLSIRKKLHVLVLVSVIIIVALSLFQLLEQKKSSLSERKGKLQAQVESALSLATHYYNNSSIYGEEEAKKRAIDAIQSLRYDGKTYFWITSPSNVVVMHPIKPQLNGKDASDFKDGSGKFHWQEMAQIGKTKGAGFLDYTWKSPDGELLDKISFVAAMPEWNWIIGTGVLISDINQAFISDLIMAGITIGIALIALAISSFILGRNIVMPIEKLLGKVHQISDGDLTLRLNTSRKDEIGDICRDMNAMLEKLQGAFTLANESANQSTDLVSSIASSSEQSAVSIQSQYAQLDLLSTAMNQMTSTTVEVSRNAEQASNTTNTVAEQATESSSDMEKTVQNIEDADNQMALTSQLVEQLNTGVMNISDVVTVIQNISEQTNLLALNAAIEAARAGEQGRGFAVVADEVRNLASSTNESTEQIQASINELTNSAQDASKAVALSREKVQTCVKSSEETRDELGRMVELLNQANDMVTQIASSAEEQGVVSNEINENVAIINTSANEMNSAATNLAQQSQVLVESSSDLAEHLKYFKV